jgi:fluoroquinolone transport system permease protein
MNRLWATAIRDARLQFRNGFYYAAGFVALFWVGLLSVLPKTDLSQVAAPVILSNLLINTFYFVGGLVILEKGEGALAAQAASPLRNWEYLVSKAATLAALALLENLILVGAALAFGLLAPPAPLLLVVGILLAAIFYTLVGFLVIIRYDSLNEYLFPSFFFTTVFVPPFLYFFGLWPGCPAGPAADCGLAGWVVYLHPLQATLVLVDGAFRAVTGWLLLYGVGYSLLWIAAALWLARRAFNHFVVRAEGAG